MPISFEEHNEIIIYVLEMIIAYARDNQYIFLARSVWCISSIIGLQQGLIIHIDNLKEQLEASSRVTEGLPKAIGVILKITNTSERILINQSDRKISTTPRDIHEESTTSNGLQDIHPDQVNQVHDSISDVSDLDLNNSESQNPSRLVEKTEQFIRKSQKKRNAFNKRKQIVSLSKTRSGRISAKPLSIKQKSYLQSIPKIRYPNI